MISIWIDLSRDGIDFGLDWDAEPDEEETEFEDGVWTLCPSCEGIRKNEVGQPCAWCATSEHPGFMPHGEEAGHDSD